MDDVASEAGDPEGLAELLAFGEGLRRGGVSPSTIADGAASIISGIIADARDKGKLAPAPDASRPEREKPGRGADRREPGDGPRFERPVPIPIPVPVPTSRPAPASTALPPTPSAPRFSGATPPSSAPPSPASPPPYFVRPQPSLPRHAGTSSVPAFERPVPVIVVGPRPLPVAFVESLTGGRGRGTPEGEEEPSGYFGKLWHAIKPHVMKTRVGRYTAKGFRVGRGVGRGVGKLFSKRRGAGAARSASGAAGRTAAGAARGGATAAAEGASGAVRALGMAGGVIGGVAAGMAGVAVAAYHLERALADSSESALESSKKFKDIDATMAQTFGEQEIKDLNRNMAHAQATAESTRRLAETDAARKDQEDRISVVADNAWNWFLSWANEQATPFLERTADAVEWIAKQFNFQPRGTSDATGLGSTVNEMQAMQRQIDRRGETLMDVARRERDRVRGGVAGPQGANRPGRGAP